MEKGDELVLEDYKGSKLFAVVLGVLVGCLPIGRQPELGDLRRIRVSFCQSLRSGVSVSRSKESAHMCFSIGLIIIFGVWVRHRVFLLNYR